MREETFDFYSLIGIFLAGWVFSLLVTLFVIMAYGSLDGVASLEESAIMLWGFGVFGVVGLTASLIYFLSNFEIVRRERGEREVRE